jgi:hypothetical protein
MPGADDSYDDANLKQLKLNPFHPAKINVTQNDLITRAEMMSSMFNAYLPTTDVLPILINEVMLKCIEKFIGNEITKGESLPPNDYPKFETAIDYGREILKKRGYEPTVEKNLIAALETRFIALTNGSLKDIINVNNSTPYATLFDRPVVINLSNFELEHQALISAMLVLSLNEYRKSQKAERRKSGEKNLKDRLMHLTVVEEAHNIIRKPSVDFSGVGNAQKVVADMFSNILSQIRTLGEGIMLIDQIPSRLIEDAVKNTNYKIVHRLPSLDDAESMAISLCLRPEQARVIPALAKGNVLAYGDMDDAASWVLIPDPNASEGDVYEN